MDPAQWKRPMERWNVPAGSRYIFKDETPYRSLRRLTILISGQPERMKSSESRNIEVRCWMFEGVRQTKTAGRLAEGSYFGVTHPPVGERRNTSGIFLPKF